MQKLTWYFIGVYIIKGNTKLSEDKVKYVKYDFNCDKILQSIQKRVQNVHNYTCKFKPLSRNTYHRQTLVPYADYYLLMEPIITKKIL